MLENVLRKVGLYTQSQNLDKKPGDGGEASGSLFRHGRLWIHEAGAGCRERFCVEWSLGESGFGFSMSVNDSEGPELSVHGKIPGLALYVTVPTKQNLIEAIQKLADVERYEGVNLFRFAVHSGGAWWELMHSDMSWKSTTPRWRHGCFRPIDAMFGDTSVDRKVISTQNVQIPMPEGTYNWTVKLERCTVTRARWSRWPFEKIAVTYKAECRDGQQIPKPGKGENSWNCGPDAIYGQSGWDVRNAEEVIGRIVESVLHDRKRRGARHNYATGGIHDPKAAN